MVNKGIQHSQQVMFVILIRLCVELETRLSISQIVMIRSLTYELQDGNLHHTLIEVRRLVLDDFHRNNIMRPHVLAFHNLTECPLSEDIQNQISECRLSETHCRRS